MKNLKEVTRIFHRFAPQHKGTVRVIYTANKNGCPANVSSFVAYEAGIAGKDGLMILKGLCDALKVDAVRKLERNQGI